MKHIKIIPVMTFRRFFSTLFISALMISGSDHSLAAELSRRTLIQVQQAYELQVGEKPGDAIAVLERIRTEREYDKAYISRMLGGLYWQVSNAGKAIETLSFAVDSEQLQQQEHRDTLRMLADILLSEGRYSEAESRYGMLISEDREAEELEWIWLRLAQAQYQQQMWARVEESLTHQQKYEKAAGLQAKVMPLNMLLGAQVARKKWAEAIGTAKALRTLEPDNFLWWRQLVTLYMYTGDNRSALITLQQMQRAGFSLDVGQITLMAQLYAFLKMPEKAARVYSSLKTLNQSAELLAQQAVYWEDAREWKMALESWDKAANLDSEYYWPLAILNMKLRFYPQALQAIDKVPQQSEEVMLAKVRVLSATGERGRALELVKQVHGATPSQESLNWIQYLSRE